MYSYKGIYIIHLHISIKKGCLKQNSGPLPLAPCQRLVQIDYTVYIIYLYKGFYLYSMSIKKGHLKWYSGPLPPAPCQCLVQVTLQNPLPLELSIKGPI